MSLRFTSMVVAVLALSACGGGGGGGSGVVTPPVVETPKGMTVLAGVTGGFGNADGVIGRFHYPLALTIDAGGALYATSSAVTVASGATVRRIAPGADGVMVAGTRWRGAEPHKALVADASGNLIGIAGNRIVRIAPDGVETLLAGSDSMEGYSGSGDGIGAQARFQGPTALAVDGAGLIYVADSYTIRTVTAAGEVRTHAAGTRALFDVTGELYGTPIGMTRYATGLAFDSAGNLVIGVADGTVRKVTPAGVRLNTTLTASTAVAADRDGSVYGWTDCTLYKADAAGKVSVLAGASARRGAVDGAGSVASFGRDSDCDVRLAVDTGGNVYVSDSVNNTIRKVTQAGVVSTVAGKATSAGLVDGVGAAARLSGAEHDLTFDGKDTLYVALDDKVRKITRAGVVTTLNLPAVDANRKPFRYYAGGMAFQGSLIGVADRVVYLVEENGNMRVLAGSPTSAPKADGTGAQAGFGNVCGAARDGSGNFYLLDCYEIRNGPANAFPDAFEHRIRKVTPAGVVSTLYTVAADDGTRQPYSVVADRQGNVYATTNNSMTVKVAAGGTVTHIPVDQQYSGRAAVDSAGNLFVSGYTTPALVHMISPTGQSQIVAGRKDQIGLIPSPMPGSLGVIYGLTVDEQGALYVLTENAVVRIIR